MRSQIKTQVVGLEKTGLGPETIKKGIWKAAHVGKRNKGCVIILPLGNILVLMTPKRVLLPKI